MPILYLHLYMYKYKLEEKKRNSFQFVVVVYACLKDTKTIDAFIVNDSVCVSPFCVHM